jgi:hypothetical protein
MKQYQIKLVPDSDLNAEGKWTDVPAGPPPGAQWWEYEKLYAPQIPDGFHMVAIQSVEVEQVVPGGRRR